MGMLPLIVFWTGMLPLSVVYDGLTVAPLGINCLD